MKLIYNFSIHLLQWLFWLASFFNNKIKKGYQGRKESLKVVQQAFNSSDQVIWMHAASLGEYEQGLPVLEKLKSEYPNHKVLITFFSPSGYENVFKKKNPADVICYLPFDTPKISKAFVEAIPCTHFFTVKYDFWYNMLNALHQKKALIFVVSAMFYEKQVYFKKIGKWMKSQLKNSVDWFFHQNEDSRKLAASIGLTQSSVSGDTRFDRVKEIRESTTAIPFIKEFINGKTTLIVGSSWPDEEEIAFRLLENKLDVKIIIAPHELSRIEDIVREFPNALLYSTLKDGHLENIESANVLIIDSIGLLSRLYAYGDAALVGGGFHDKGLHNILEAATYGLAVFFGNHYTKNPEADQLIDCRGAMSFDNNNDAVEAMTNILQDSDYLKSMGEHSRKYVDDQPNASEIVIRKIKELSTSY